LPAFTPVKSIKKSAANEVVLFDVPVVRKIKVPVPLCTPPLDPVENEAEETVVLVASGIAAEPITATGHQRFAPIPEAKPFVQFAISEKFSV
jgi:hypothetical protein